MGINCRNGTDKPLDLDLNRQKGCGRIPTPDSQVSDGKTAETTTRSSSELRRLCASTPCNTQKASLPKSPAQEQTGSVFGIQSEGREYAQSSVRWQSEHGEAAASFSPRPGSGSLLWDPRPLGLVGHWHTSWDKVLPRLWLGWEPNLHRTGKFSHFSCLPSSMLWSTVSYAAWRINYTKTDFFFFFMTTIIHMVVMKSLSAVLWSKSSLWSNKKVKNQLQGLIFTCS